MADLKISELTNLTAADPVSDMLPIVDVSATPPASGSTKRISINNLLSSSPTASGALTVTGLVTAGSASITGDLTVDTSTLVVDATNNRVGVLTASPRSGFALDVLGNVAIGSSASTGSFPLIIDSLGTAGNVASIRFKAANVAKAYFGLSGSFAGDATTDAIIATDAAGAAIRFYVADTGLEAMRLNSTANLVLKGGTAGASGVGLTFPATQVASSDANCLDDYEEGTWTIGLTFGSLSVGLTTSASTGRYTKIGRQVTVSGLLNLTSKGSSTGIAEIQGLPFTIANGNEVYSAANVRFNGVSFADVPISIGAPNSTKILLQEITNAGVVTDLTDADFSNSSQCIISFTYTV